MSDPVDPIRVLHVDDDPDLVDLAATYLRRENDRFTVEAATSASEALERLDTDAEAVDCVVSDYDMPGANGIEFLETVRERHTDLPFILFTGKGSEEVASEAISAGVTDYLQKQMGTDQYAILANRIRNSVERQRAQRQQRRQLDAIETAREGISILEDGRFVYVNRGFADVYGYDPEAIVGERWDLIYPETEAERVTEVVESTLAAEGIWHGETVGLRADGSTFVNDHALATTDADDELICTVRDITDRKERERRFEAIFHNTHTFVGLLDPDGTVLEVNRTALSFAGQEREDVVGVPVWETDWFWANETSRQVAREAVERARGGDLFRDEIRIQGVDREAVIDLTVRPVTDERGTVTELITEARDITERKRRVRKLETLVSNLPGMMYRCANEPGWPMEDVRGQVEALTGYPPSAFEDRTGVFGTDIIHEADREEVWEAVQDAVERAEAFEITYRIVSRDGTAKWVWERGQGVRSSDGDLEAIEGFITDITTRKESAAKLREERAFVQQALDALDEVFYVVGADGGVERWNESLSTVTGYSDAEIAEMQAVEFFVEDHRERVAAAIEEALTAGTVVVEADLHTAAGERVPYELTGSRLTDAAGDVTGLVGVGREISGREREPTGA